MNLKILKILKMTSNDYKLIGSNCILKIKQLGSGIMKLFKIEFRPPLSLNSIFFKIFSNRAGCS